MFGWKNWIVIAALAGCALVALAAPGPSSAVTDEDATTEAAETAQEAPKAVKAKAALDGVKVFGWYCGACHSERYPRERTDGEWDMIVTHMRVRANLSADQTKAVLRYLKENNE